MTLCQGFGNLGIAPFAVQCLLDVFGQEIGEALPFPVVQFVPDGNEAVSLVVYRDNRSAQPLLLLPLKFLDLVLLEMTPALLDDLLFDPIAGKQGWERMLHSTVPVLELTTAATKTWGVAAD